jgi:hypothetical protein
MVYGIPHLFNNLPKHLPYSVRLLVNKATGWSSVIWTRYNLCYNPFYHDCCSVQVAAAVLINWLSLLGPEAKSALPPPNLHDGWNTAAFQ